MDRFQQVPDAFRDDAGLPGTGARNHQKRPLAMRDRAALSVVQLQPALLRGFPSSNSVDMIQEG